MCLLGCREGSLTGSWMLATWLWGWQELQRLELINPHFGDLGVLPKLVKHRSVSCRPQIHKSLKKKKNTMLAAWLWVPLLWHHPRQFALSCHNQVVFAAAVFKDWWSTRQVPCSWDVLWEAAPQADLALLALPSRRQPHSPQLPGCSAPSLLSDKLLPVWLFRSFTVLQKGLNLGLRKLL